MVSVALNRELRGGGEEREERPSYSNRGFAICTHPTLLHPFAAFVFPFAPFAIQRPGLMNHTALCGGMVSLPDESAVAGYALPCPLTATAAGASQWLSLIHI